jgi:hypothetical protein
MYGIFLSALATALTFLVRSVLVKFVLYFALFFVASEFMGYVANKLPAASVLNQAFTAIPSGVWFFFDLFQVGLGVKLCLAAYVTRFAIRRIPLIG